jgi:GAF domain-containing protein
MPPTRSDSPDGDSFIDPEVLERSLGALRGRAAEAALPSALHDAIETTRTLFSATGAGLMMIDESMALCAVAATDEPARILETRQEQLGRGPCVDALTLDRTVVTQDLASDERWPDLSLEMSALGVRAMLGVPIRFGGLPVGSLNVYSSRAGEWSHSQVAALEAYGGVIDGLLLAALRAQRNEFLVRQLQRALDNRVVIERAVGALMARHRVDAVSAFGQLRDEARSSQSKAALVAAQILSDIAGETDGTSSVSELK